MRNLSLLASRTTGVISDIDLANEKTVTATAIDLDQNVLYAASERVGTEGEVDIELWRVDSQTNTASCFTMFSTMARPSTSSSASVPQITALHILPDSRQICVITRSGDITVASLDDEVPVPDVEGTVEPGIFAASWSPDEELLALVTGERKLILMTSAFDVLSEEPMETQSFGEDEPINVGWGSKQTQFHGSIGKQAAQAPTTPAVASKSPDDDDEPRISWRGDATLFSVSSLSGENASRRVIRVYSRTAALQATSETVPGLEHAMSWRPSGNLIASCQRFGKHGLGAGKEGRHDIVFFERNGLRHGEFGLVEKEFGSAIDRDEGVKLQWGYMVKEIGWSSDSNVFSVWIRRTEGKGPDIVQLWTIGNYHWYLKQEITAPNGGYFTSVSWHPEVALRLLLTTNTSVIERNFIWETITASSHTTPDDSGNIAVFDGSNVLLTPFRSQNVPPPMSSSQLSVLKSRSHLDHHTRVPTHISFSSPASSDFIGILWDAGFVELYSLKTRLGPGKGKVMDPTFASLVQVGGGQGASYRQLQIYGRSSVLAVLGTLANGVDCIILATLSSLETGDVVSMKTIELPSANGRLVSNDYDEKVYWQSSSGSSYDLTEEPLSLMCEFGAFCPNSLAMPIGTDIIFAGLSDSSKLYLSCRTSNRSLESGVTSMTVASGFLIYTNTTHVAKFAPLEALPALLLLNEVEELPSVPTDWETRRVERGSRIVVAVPSTMSLVLQMPRGNLETINPRPMVMEVVKSNLERKDYRKAFMSCRKHRIDLNVIVDHDQKTFMENLSLFIDQIPEVDHINLFLTNLSQSSKPPTILSELCDGFRQVLKQRDFVVYVNCILTAYVMRKPAQYEEGLTVLLNLRELHPEVVEDAVKYIIFLVDADTLFDTALGMYDFNLVLMIAQHAQKDPREYLPFLRELRSLEKYIQQFRINDHLRRHDRALKSLHLAGPDYFKDAVNYIERHQLYSSALSIWKNDEHYSDVLVIYGDWLFDRREYSQAATAFVEAKALSKALVSYEKALQWQDLFDVAVRLGRSDEELSEIAYRISEDLSSKKRYTESARVLLDYAHDVREAVIYLVQGNEFSEARRVITLNKRQELLEEIIQPGLLESRSQTTDDLNEMRDQLRKQLSRLRELRVRKVEEPDAFYGIEDTALHNVDVMTDVSMPATAFTRYTVAPTTASRRSKQTSRSKRKAERKVGSGKKGTVDEEEYLFRSVTKLVIRFSNTMNDVQRLLPHLYEFEGEHRDEGLALQKEVAAFETELKEDLDWIWEKKADEESEDTWAQRMQEADRKRLLSSSDKVEKPKISGNTDWKIRLLELST